MSPGDTATASALTILAPTADGVASPTHCVAVGITARLTWRCGALRVQVELPDVTVRGERLVPRLVYNSQQARPMPLVAVAARLPVAPRPIADDSVRLALVVDGDTVQRRAVSARTWARPTVGPESGAVTTVRRVVLGVDAATWPTGVYPFTLVAKYDTVRAVAAGQLLVVNRARSPFGAGWSLEGVESLSPLGGHQLADADSLLWVGDEGEARIYRRLTAGDSVFHATAFERPDSLLQTATGFARVTPHDGRVLFDVAGHHVATTEPGGRSLAFDVDSAGRLRMLRVLGPSASRAYAFQYGAPLGGPGDERTASMVTRIDAPDVTTGQPSARRAVRVTIVRGQLRRVVGPDGFAQRFGYVGAAPLLREAIDRAGTPWWIAYDSLSGQASGAWTTVPQADGSTQLVAHHFGAAEGAGLAEWSPDPLVPSTAYAWHDGPRTDVADVTRVWVDAYGQPTLVRTADGHETRLRRADPRFHALVTTSIGPTGLVTHTAHDARGNATTVTVENPLGDGRAAVTRYAWDPRWDLPTEIVTPEGVVTRLGYDARTGQLAWQEDGHGLVARVTYHVDAFGELDSVHVPGVARAEAFTYDALGNLVTLRTPAGRAMRHLRDALGRDTLLVGPVDATDTLDTRWTRWTRIAYDAAGRVARTVHVGRTSDDTTEQTIDRAEAAESLTVTRAYDPEGRLLQFERVAGPGPLPIGAAVRDAWRYDALGRVIIAIAPDGLADSSAYDPAGNLVRRVTRRGHVLTHGYDAMNRLVQRVSAAVRYPPQVVDGWRFPADAVHDTAGVWLPADTARFTYDAADRVLTATNREAEVTRTYFPGGLLQTDRLHAFAQPANGDRGDSLAPIGASTATWHVAYDLDGRRVQTWRGRRDVPPNSMGTTYGYDTTGALARVREAMGDREFTLAHDAAGRTIAATSPDGIDERWHFDDDGDVDTTWRVRGIDTLRTTLQRDVAGRLRRVDTDGYVDGAGPGDAARVTADYTGLGHLRALQQTVGDTELAEAFALDGFGQLLRGTRRTRSLGASTTDRVDTRYAYSLRNIGRLTDRWESADVDTADTSDGRAIGRHHNDYDASGNLVVEARTHPLAGPSSDVSTVTVRYYDAEERLRLTDRRVTRRDGAASTETQERQREATRYDAFGRRLTTVVRIDTGAVAGPPTQQWIQSFVWDGDQLVEETRTAFGADVAGGRERVRYTYGVGGDDVLSVVRDTPNVADTSETADTTAAGRSVVVVPHRDWRGMPTIDGSTAWPGVPNDQPPSLEAYALGGRSGATSPGAPWWGTRLASSTEAQVLGARAYDPTQQRFVQEDPLGVAGGPTAYAYAGGDPLTFGDPTGTCQVDVRFARLGSLLGKAWYHAYVVTTAPDLTQLFFRGGPSGGGPSGGTVGQLASALVGLVGRSVSTGSGVTEAGAVASAQDGSWGLLGSLWGTYAPGTVDWDPSASPAVRLVDDHASCEAYVTSFLGTLQAVANRRIPYAPFTTNSNALARELLARAGLSLSHPVLWAPGWSTVLLR